MSMIRTFSIAFSTTLTLAACDQAEPLSAEPQPQVETSFRDTPSHQELKDMFCKAKRQIAVKLLAAGSCPSASGWVGSKVFPNAPGLLGKVCEYEWDFSYGSTPNVAGLQALSELHSVMPDCGAVFVQSTGGDAVWDAVGVGLADAYHHAIGRPTADDLSLSTTNDPRWKVAVAVVDTVPEPQPAAPRSIHGELMVGIVNDIACPAGTTNCEVKVKRSLGLPRHGLDAEKDLVNGGVYGTQFDAARAIRDSVLTWKNTAWGNEPAKLVINLSFGWDRTIYGDISDADASNAVKSVYEALEFAACHKAIVIAAAGNLSASCTEGALAPAAWQEHLGPDAQRCQELLGDPNATSAADRPLVYSVAGLTHDLQQMAGTRLGSVSEFAMVATNAVTSAHDNSVTGSSAAAAALTGGAALVWSYNPHLSPAEVMNVLYDNGDVADVDGMFLASGMSATNVHAINICEALEAACNQSGASCPADPFDTVLDCIGRAPTWDTEDMNVLLENSVDATYAADITAATPTPCPDECEEFSAAAWQAIGSAPSVCPIKSAMDRPFTLPQPNQVACPNCTLDPPNFVVYASLDPNFDDVNDDDEVSDINIAILDSAGAATYYRFGDIELYSDQITSIVLDRMPADVSSAAITITFETGRTVVDPLLIGPQ